MLLSPATCCAATSTTPDIAVVRESRRCSRPRSTRSSAGPRRTRCSPLTLSESCLLRAIEMIAAVGSPRNDQARYGAEALARLAPPGRLNHPDPAASRSRWPGRPPALRPDAGAAVGDLDGRVFLVRPACSPTTPWVPGADKFIADRHPRPGCPPRPEALFYGFNKLQRMIQGHPDQGWRRRYNAVGTEEWARDERDLRPAVGCLRGAYGRARQAVAAQRPSQPGLRGRGQPPSRGAGYATDGGGDPLMPDAPGLELIALVSYCDAHPGSVLGTYHEHGGSCLIVDPLAGPRRYSPGSATRRGRSNSFSLQASTASTTCRPSRVSASTTSSSTATALNESGVRAALADLAPTRCPTNRTPMRPVLRPVPDSRVPRARAVYDFFGVVFSRGHPDLRRISCCPEILRGLAAAPRLPVGGEPVIFTYNEHQLPRGVTVSSDGGERHGSAPASGGDLLAETTATVIGASPVERHRGRRAARTRARAADHQPGPATHPPPLLPTGSCACWSASRARW